MGKLKTLWRNAVSQRVWEELEVWIGVLLALGAAAVLYATLTAQAAYADEFPTDVGAPTLLFQTADGGYLAAAPLQTDLRLSVAGVVARVRVSQRFRNSGANYIEAVYALPLPDDAAVDRLSMQIGDRIVEGEIQERQRAERIYGEARAAGQRASLVRQTSANLFTTAVANIGPGETIDITIEYLQTARYDAGEFSLRVPLTLTPRYGASDTPEGSGALDSAVTAEAAGLESPTAAGLRSAPWHEAYVHAVLAPGMPLEWIGSPSHELTAVHERGPAWSAARESSKVENGAAVAGVLVQPPPAELYVLDTVAPRVPMDRDLVVAWRPQTGVAPGVAALTETVGDTTYALLMILPPAAAHTARAQAREQIYVVDTSGSMAGQSMVQAKAALKDALGRLNSGDRFNVIQFNSTTSTLYLQPVQFSAGTYKQALAYVAGLTANGGTEIAAAIDTALSQPTVPGSLRQVIFMTDGAVNSETSLYAAIEQRLGDARLFTIGIGSAPNSQFMRKAAQFGRGTFTHIGNVNDVAEKMTALFDKIEHVALSNVVVDWPEAVELYPHEIPDLYAGEPLVVAASFPARPDKPLLTTAYGQAGGLPWRQPVAGMPSELPGIATLWARRKIETLLDSRVAGTDEALIRKLVVATALEHHLVSPYTSLVAVDKTPARAAVAALERRT
ncbi:MAG TPA: marine proteobacterial sortase target protein, partial [Gammaproteobacteria bacterium]|nr:marine proteobacterial sortase target protein [Gammaproteobacteria bacterium]